MQENRKEIREMAVAAAGEKPEAASKAGKETEACASAAGAKTEAVAEKKMENCASAAEGRPILWIVVPCYNEEAVLPITAPLFLGKIQSLAAAGKISDRSRVLFVNDGSKDKTWQLITDFAAQDAHYIGISQSRNRGHQNAVLAGLMEAKDVCDITISIDCDGQDDIDAMDQMVDEYLKGAEVVYGVRSSRATDTWFKRTTAESFYGRRGGLQSRGLPSHQRQGSAVLRGF